MRLKLTSNEAPNAVPVRGRTKLPHVGLEEYPVARLVLFTMKPHDDSDRDVSIQISYLMALQEVDARFADQFHKDPALRKVYREMRMDSYSLLEIEGDDPG